MNRLSWDTTAPRRMTAKRTPSPGPRSEDAALADTADLIRVAWDKQFRVTTF